MQRSYNICGLNVSADFRHGFMLPRAEKYLSQGGAADIMLPYNRPFMERLMAEGENIDEHSAENIATADMFYTALLRFEGFMLHSSAVAVDGRAYLFSAPSGTGKSTHTSLWRKVFGSRAQIINDDKPALRIRGGEVIAYGTPWSGKSDLNINIGVPVQGICVLERSEENYIAPLSESEAIYCILNQTVRPSDAGLMDSLLSLVDRVIADVPVWKMGCNISTEAAEMAYNAMRPK